MAVSFEDVDLMRRGRESKAQELAGRQLDEMLNSMQQQTQIEQQQVSQEGEDKLTQDAMMILEHLDDPKEIEKLDPRMQEKIYEILNGNIPDDHPELQQGNPDQQLPMDNSDGEQQLPESNPNEEQQEVIPTGDEQPSQVFQR